MGLIGCLRRENERRYRGEPSANSFLKRKGSEYPRTGVRDRGYWLWLRNNDLFSGSGRARPSAGDAAA
jgi:hypothetical protein